MITKEIKNAIMDVLMASIDRGNYGMYSNKRASFYSHKLLAQNGIKFPSEYSIEQNGVKIATIKRRYAARKVNGMYKELKPQIEYLA